ncbi:DUF4962 domain-containing protein [Limisphaera sp. VF-2]|uniref:DUF4962 domain-containing protein n=1 Tax=Limisphaera sp. VF-2 TaxID=3400418 RepID=UPI003C139268
MKHQGGCKRACGLWLRVVFMIGGLTVAADLPAAQPPAASEPPQVSDRPARPDEIGYRPREGEVVPLNPPAFTWLVDRGATRWAVQWSREPDFRKAETAEDLPFNVYVHARPLEAGRYFWRYRFVTQEGRTSTWSRVRSFVVPTNAVVFPMPTRAEQRARLPQGRPRLFLRPEDLSRLREWAKGPGAAEFATLRAAADRYIEAGPTPEPEHLGSINDRSNREMVRYWWPNREQALRACQEAETIAFVYLITREPKYAAAARRWILHLASWDPDGPTNFRLNCEAGKVMLHRPSRAYDWAWDVLTESEREQVRQVMARRARDAWNSGEVGRGVGHLERPFSSHGNRTWHKLAETAIAFYGEIPEAETWLDYAVHKFYAAYPVWADDDGGWHEGLSYWAGYMGKIVWWCQVAEAALGIDSFRKPFFSRVGEYALYVAPPGSPNMGFGDLSHNTPSRSWGAFLEYFLRRGGHHPDAAHAPEWRWWAEQWRMQPAEGVLGFLYRATLAPLPGARPPTNLPVSKVFHGIGVASLHTTLLDSADDVHVLFKSSPFGSQSHGHNPQNSFQLNAFGEALLTTCVYRDLHGSPFHTRWAWSTRAHNAVLVDGEGQVPHSAMSTGRIVKAILTPAWDYVEGDAVGAYGGRLTRARRKLLFVKPDLVVLCDDLAAPRPATFQFLLHGLSPFQVDEAAGRLRLERPRARLTAQYLAPVPLRFRQWDGYEPPPDRAFPNQWHVEASTQETRDRIQVLTVLQVARPGGEPSWGEAEGIWSKSAVGVRLRGPSGDLWLGFRLGDEGRAELGPVRFDTPVIVQREGR